MLSYEQVKSQIEEHGCQLLSKTYEKSINKLKLKCPCGNIFYRSHYSYISQKNKRCSKCNHWGTKYTYNDVKRLIESKNLKLISKEYIKAGKPLEVKCRCGVIFFRNLNKILYETHICISCSRKHQINKIHSKKLIEVRKLINITGCFLLSKSYNGTHQKLSIKCRVCETPYKESWNDFNRKKKYCCLSCSAKQSKGSFNIEKYLIENNITYAKEYRISNCKHIRPLPFDFAILNNSQKVVSLIEFQGEQHYRPIPLWGGIKGLKTSQKRDKIKKEYCQSNNIPFLEIKYDEEDDISNILTNFFHHIK